MNVTLSKKSKGVFLRIWKYVMYDISEQYANDIVPYHFLNIPSV